MPDYTFYTTDYLGEDIPEDQFPRYARRAGLKLERMRQLYATAPRPRRAGCRGQRRLCDCRRDV